MIKTSDELPEFRGWEETFGDWRGLGDYWHSWLHWESASSLCLCLSVHHLPVWFCSTVISRNQEIKSWWSSMETVWVLHQQRRWVWPGTLHLSFFRCRFYFLLFFYSHLKNVKIHCIVFRLPTFINMINVLSTREKNPFSFIPFITAVSY